MKSPPLSAQRAAIETAIAKFASLTPRTLGMRDSERTMMIEHLRAALETMKWVERNYLTILTIFNKAE